MQSVHQNPRMLLIPSTSLSQNVRYGSPQFLEEVSVLLLQSTLGEPTTRTCVHQLGELLSVEVKQVLEVDASVGELLKNSLLSCL